MERQFCSYAARQTARRFGGRSLYLSEDAAVATVAFSKILDRFEEILLREVGPQLLGDVHFRVGKLPEKKIREPHFAGSADQQIGIGIITRVKMFAEHVDVDHRAIDVARLDLAQQTLYSVDDLQPTAVTERKNQGEAGVHRRAFDGIVKLFLATRRQIRQTSDRLEPDIFLQQLRRFFF